MDGDSRPIAYASCRLLKHEVCYSVVEREYLVSKCGIDLFKYYLMGHEFMLITDHAPLRWLQTSKMDNARIMRWSLGPPTV